MSLINYLTTNLQLINVSNISAFGIDIKVISYFCCTNLAEIAILTQTYIYILPKLKKLMAKRSIVV